MSNTNLFTMWEQCKVRYFWPEKSSRNRFVREEGKGGISINGSVGDPNLESKTKNFI